MAQLRLLEEQLAGERRLAPAERRTPWLCLPSKNNAPGCPSQGSICFAKKKSIVYSSARGTMRMHQRRLVALGRAGLPAPGPSQREALGNDSSFVRWFPLER